MKTAIYDKNGIKIAGDSSLIEQLPNHILNEDLPLIENGGLYSRLSDGSISLIYADEKALIGFVEKKNENKRLTKNEFIKNMLFGMVGTDIKNLCNKYAFSFDEARRVLVAELNEDISGFISPLEEIFDDEAITVIGLDGHRIAVICLENDTDIEEMADAMAATFTDLNTDFNIGVSGICTDANELFVAFEQALSAIRLGKKLSFSGGVWFFGDLMPEQIISELPLDAVAGLKEKAEQVCKTLDAESIEIAQEFFKHNLNISETAKHCYFHRNSLTNKLDKIQKETGYNMRSFNEAVALRFYIAANKVLK